MNDLIQRIKVQARKLKEEAKRKASWAKPVWRQIQEALHSFHGKGFITVQSVESDTRTEVRVLSMDDYRFRCELTQYGITFGCKTWDRDICYDNEKEALGQAVTLMANVVMEADIGLEETLLGTLATEAKVEVQRIRPTT